MHPKTNDLLTIPQAAVLYGCHNSYLYREIDRGHLAIVEIAGKKFISRPQLDEFMQRPKLHDQKLIKSRPSKNPLSAHKKPRSHKNAKIVL